MKTKGFTLVELMVVVLIVGILAAVAIPMMQGRIDAAKWSEGQAAAGSIATAMRAYAAEGKDPNDLEGTKLSAQATYEALGFASDDLNGTYFTQDDYTISDVTDGKTFTIQVDNTDLNPQQKKLEVTSGKGEWK